MSRLWNPEFWVKFWDVEGPRILGAVGSVVITIVVMAIALLLARRIIARVATVLTARSKSLGNDRRTRQTETIRSILNSIVGYAIVIIGTIMILANIGIDIKTLLAGVGVVGLAIGFGAQQLVRDVLAGIFILVEDQYAVGDFVTVGGQAGYVQEVGMRFTRLLDEDGRQVWIANGAVTTVINHSRGPIELRLSFRIAAPDGIDTVVAKLRQISEGLPHEAVFHGITLVEAGVVTAEFRARSHWQLRGEADGMVREEIARRILAAGLSLA